MRLTGPLGRFAALAFIGSLTATGCGDDGINHLPDGPPSTPTDGPPQVKPGVLKLSQDSADFGSVVSGDTSAATTITVANVGEGPTGTISAAISGAMGSNFAVQSTDCTTLAPAATCSVSVVFKPNAVGSKAASLEVTAAPGGTVMASLAGTSIPPGQLTITPSTNQFANTVVGAAAATNATFTVKNTGAATSGTLTTTTSGADAGQFTHISDGCNGQTLAAGATCTIVLGFKPTSSGPKFGSLAVTGSPGGTAAASVNGTALSDAQLFLNPTSQSFGSVVTGSASSDVTFTLVNIGGVTSGSIAQALAGTGAASFAVTSSTCANATLAPGTSCTVAVHFAPTATGNAVATLTFNATPGGGQTASLTGTGNAPGQLSITPSIKAFGNLTIGQTSAGQDFTVTNTGGVASGAITANLSTGDTTQFLITNNTCAGVSLAPAGTCTVTAKFAPSTAGAKASVLRVAATPGGAVTAALSGNGLPVATLSISPSSHDFGSVAVGDTTGVQVFTITNVGGSNTGVPSASLSGPNANQFTFTSSCAAALVPLGTCTVSVRFAPSALGSDVAQVNVSANPGNTVSANVFGEGVSAAALSAFPSSIGFDTVAIGDVSEEECQGEPAVCHDPQFVVTNHGQATTGTITIAMTGANPSDFAVTSSTCSTLAAEQSCVVSVHFAPTARGQRNASARVSATPGGAVSVALSGNAIPRLEIISVKNGFFSGNQPNFDDPYDFGTTSIHSDIGNEVTITVRNNTFEDQPLEISGSDLDTFDHPNTTADFWEEENNCVGGEGGGGGGGGEETFTGKAHRRALHTMGHKVRAHAAPVKHAQKKKTAAIAVPTGNGTIFAEDTCTIVFYMEASSLGPKTGNVTFSIGPTLFDKASEGFIGTAVFGLYWSKTFVNPKEVTSIDFGNVVEGATSPTIPMYLFNRNDGPFPTGAISVSNANAQEFPFTDGCWGHTLIPGNFCEVDFRFVPQHIELLTTLTTASATPGGTPGLQENGTGVDPQFLIINPTPVLFDDVLHGMTATQVVTVTNPAGAQTTGPFYFSLGGDTCNQGSGSGGSGSSNQHCYSILIGDPTDCVYGQTIPNGSTCHIRIQFNSGPGALDTWEYASLFVQASPGINGGSEIINVSAFDQSTISISPSGQLAFGDVNRGSPSTRTFAIKNESTSDVQLQSRQGFVPQDLSFNDGCSGAVIPAGAQCSVSVRFDPQTDQESLNRLFTYLTSDGNGGVLNYAITGLGHAVNTSWDEDDGYELDFNSSAVLTLTNHGSETGTVASIALTSGSGYSVTNDQCTNHVLVAGGACNVTVTHVGCTSDDVLLSASVSNDSGGEPVEIYDLCSE